MTPKPHKTKPSKYHVTHQIKRLQSCRKYNPSKAGDLVARLRIVIRRRMLPTKHELHTASPNVANSTSYQRTTKQNQKYPGTHQIKRLQSCRKYNPSKAGDLVPRLRIVIRRHMLPTKHELHTASPNVANSTSYQRTTKQNQKYPGTHQLKLC